MEVGVETDTLPTLVLDAEGSAETDTPPTLVSRVFSCFEPTPMLFLRAGAGTDLRSHVRQLRLEILIVWIVWNEDHSIVACHREIYFGNCRHRS